MIEQFRYAVSGRHVNGAPFQAEMLVIANSEKDAEDEAIACIDSCESVLDWSLTPHGRSPADENEARMFDEHGTFAVFDLGFLNAGSGGNRK